MHRPSSLIAALLAALVCLHGRPVMAAEEAAAQPPTFKPEEIEQLVAPIALYPDSLLAQVLMASTYPLEVVEAARWAKENPKLKDKALEDALQKQTWDASVKSLTAFPPVLTMMNEKLDWTQKLGDAFLAQQSDVMDAVQRLRAKAKAEGNLKTTEQQKVIEEPAPPPPVQQNVTVESPPAQTTIIKVEPADPQVVYVPTYNPTTVYGSWPYPAYPPYYYYPPGYVAATSLISFGVGMAVGSALWGGCNWGGYGHNDIDIDVNRYNNFNRTDISNKKWEHKPEHRKGVQYRDQRTQQRYNRGGSQRDAKSREQFRGRAEQGRRDLSGKGGDRARQDLAREQGRQRDAQRAGSAQRDRSGQGGAQQRDRQHQAQRQPQRDRPAQHSASRSSRNAGAFQGMDSGRSARAASSRGQASRQSARSFGGGGGGRGGGGRGGGGRRR